MRIETDAERRAVTALLSDEFVRTGDGVIEGAVAKVYGDDPCRWAHVATLSFSYVKDMRLRCRPFPSEDDIRRNVAELSKLKERERVTAVQKLLQVLSDEQTDKEHDVVLQALRMLAEDYLRRSDEEILEGFDSFELGNGGFLLTACSFYREIWGAPGFEQRYKPEGEPRKALRRCVGTTISEDEFQRTGDR